MNLGQYVPTPEKGPEIGDLFRHVSVFGHGDNTTYSTEYFLVTWVRYYGDDGYESAKWCCWGVSFRGNEIVPRDIVDFTIYWHNEGWELISSVDV